MEAAFEHRLVNVSGTVLWRYEVLWKCRHYDCSLSPRECFWRAWTSPFLLAWPGQLCCPIHLTWVRGGSLWFLHSGASGMLAVFVHSGCSCFSFRIISPQTGPACRLGLPNGKQGRLEQPLLFNLKTQLCKQFQHLPRVAVSSAAAAHPNQPFYLFYFLQSWCVLRLQSAEAVLSSELRNTCPFLLPP